MKRKKTRPRFKAYNCITIERRSRLISMINDDSMRIKDAATELNINYQTAKSIIRRFRASESKNLSANTKSLA
jgi:transposase